MRLEDAKREIIKLTKGRIDMLPLRHANQCIKLMCHRIANQCFNLSIRQDVTMLLNG